MYDLVFSFIGSTVIVLVTRVLVQIEVDLEPFEPESDEPESYELVLES